MELLVKELSDFCLKQEIEFSSKHANPAQLNSLNGCTYAEHFTSAMAVFPSTQEQIQCLVAEAHRLKESHPKLTIYPISQGKNWGYGSATPTTDQAILLSLQAFKSEISWLSNSLDPVDTPYGKKLGVVRVGANITQQQLCDFLQAEGGEFWMDATGAPKESSIVGNYLERGFGHTQMGDHFRHVMGLEVILPDGSFVKTGHAGCNNAANVGIHKHGLGPSLEGIFSQSSLGIVTAIYLELMPAKKHLTKFFLQLPSDEAFYQAVACIQPLKMKGVLTSQMHCGNAHKSIQASMRYPFAQTNNVTPLPAELAQQIKQQHDIACWIISGAIYGDSRMEVWLKQQQLKKALKGVKHKRIILSESLARLAKQLVALPIVKWVMPQTQLKLTTQLTLLSELIKLKKGIPTNFFMNSTYWRKRQPPSASAELDPHADNVGMLWVAPIAPATYECVKKMVELSTEISEKYQFEPAISITLLNDKAADCILSISYDRDFADEEARAMACYTELKTAFNQQGFSAYRASKLMMKNKELLNYSSELTGLHRQLKAAIDPSGLIAPGHYI